MPLKASILCACFNSERYIADCIKSILSQTHKNWELIIIDDKSTDTSCDIIEKFAKKDGRINLYRSTERLQCGSAYNKALEIARGDVCCVLDSDDALSHNKSLDKLLKVYREHKDIDYIWTQFYICDHRLRILRKGFSSYPGKHSLLEAGKLGKHCFSHWRTFRTHLKNKGPIFKTGLASAVDKWMGYALEELGAGAFLQKALYFYRQCPGGLSYTGKKNWKIMKKEFSERREQENIKIYPIRKFK